MTSHSQLHKVKQFKPKKVGECARKTFFSIMFFSLLGAICGIALSCGIIFLAKVDTIIVTLLLVSLGTGIGAFYGKSKGAGCNNDKSFLYAITPVSIFLILIALTRAYFSFRYGFDDKNIAIVIEIMAILSTPLGIYWIYTNQFYCHHCKKNYQSTQLFASKTTSPYKVLSLLNNKQIFPHVFDLEKDNSFPLYKDQIEVTVTAEYCPNCYDAVVDAVLTYSVGSFKKEYKTLLFYSNFWTGDKLKKVFQFETEQDIVREIQPTHYSESNKLLPAMQCYYSIKKLLTALLILFIAISVCYLIAMSEQDPNKKLLAWVFMGIFSLTCIPFLIILFDRRVQICIDYMGIENLKMGMMYWQDIEKIYLQSIETNGNVNQYIWIELSNTDKYKKLAKKKLAMTETGRINIQLNFSLLTLSTNKAWQYIEQICQSKHYLRNEARINEYVKPK